RHEAHQRVDGRGAERSRQVGVRTGHLEVGRARGLAPPLLALAQAHVPADQAAPTADEAATTPRKSASAAARAVAAVSGRGATSPSWRNRSISCLMLRTKSPPVRSFSSPSTSSRLLPAAQAWAWREKPA